MNARKVLAWITPTEPFGLNVEAPADHAAQSVHMAVADFFIAIHEAKSVNDALKLRQIIGVLMLSLGAAEDAALARADQLSSKS